MTREELDQIHTTLLRRCLGDDRLCGALQALVREAGKAVSPSPVEARLSARIAALEGALREVYEVLEEIHSGEARGEAWAWERTPAVLKRAAAALGEEEG